MGLWDNIKDWFTKDEKYQFDEEKKAKEEKELMDKLFDLDKQLTDADEAAYKAAQEAAKPVEEKLEYVDIDKTTDDEIAKKASEKYAKEQEEKKKELEESYGNKQSKQEDKLADAQESAELKQDKLLQNKAIKEEKVKNNAIESGLLDSSIAATQKEQVAELTQQELDNLSDATKKQLDRLSGDLEYLNAMKEQALAKHDQSMADKINGEIASLTKSRDNLIAKQKQHNETTDYKKQKYEKALAAAEEKVNSSWKSQMDKRNAEEAKIGYGGDRKVNYDERLKVATEYYSQYPKEVAIQLIDNNPQLKVMMGNNMYKLKHAITNNGK